MDVVQSTTLWQGFFTGERRQCLLLGSYAVKSHEGKTQFSDCLPFIPDISIAPLQVHYYSEELPTTALILCRSQHTKALQATVSEGLAQGPYVAARVGFKPATLQMQDTELTTEPSHPTWPGFFTNTGGETEILDMTYLGSICETISVIGSLCSGVT